MLSHLDPVWLALAFAMVAILAFILGLALDVLMTGGFFATIVGANYRGISFVDLAQATAAGMVGAFACLSLFALLKAGLARL